MSPGGIGRLWRDRRGVAATELALVLPMLLLLSAGAIEAGLMLMTDASLEMALRRAMRFGMTNQGGGTREENIRTMLTDVMKTWAGEDGTVDLTFKAYSSLDNIGKPEPYTDKNNNGTCDEGEQSKEQDINGNGKWDADMAATTAGGSGDIVIYIATLKRPGFTGVLRLAGIGDLTFSRQMAITNE